MSRFRSGGAAAAGALTMRYEAQATALGGRDGSVASADGRLRLALDRPAGGRAEGCGGTNPEQMFAAAYAACFLSALAAEAAREGLTLAPDANVTATVGLTRSAGAPPALDVALDIDLPALPRDVAERLAAAAHAVCPYSRAFGPEVPVVLRVA